MTKTQRKRFQHVKNLVKNGMLDEAYRFSRNEGMNLRHYQDAVDAGLSLRKEQTRG